MKNEGNQSAVNWTDAQIEDVKRLWTEGSSAGQIGKMIGKTRNAVIGKVHRLKMPPRLNPTKMNRPPKPHGNRGQPKVNAIVAAAEARRRKPPTLPTFDAEPFDMEDGEGVDVTARIGLVEASDTNGCMWVHGDPLLPNHSFCGKPRKGKTSWCSAHHARVYPGSAS